MKKIVLPILIFLGFVGIVFSVLWGVSTIFYYTAATYMPTPTPHLLSNEVNLQPLLDVNFALTQKSFEESINLELLKNSPQVSFPPAYQTIPLNDLSYSYQTTNPAGLRTNVDVFITYTSPSTIPTSSDCALPTKIYLVDQSEDKHSPYSFCVSYLDQPNELFYQADYYTASIQVQKDDLHIWIREWTETTERQTINEVIQQLAEVLKPTTP